MSQKKSHSLLEALCNTASGFIVSMLVWRFIAAPYLGIPVSMQDNLVITGIFTAASIVRGYLWRRLFNQATQQGTL